MHFNRLLRAARYLSKAAGLSDTCWSSSDGTKVTLKEVIDATEDIPVEDIDVDILRPHLLSWDGDNEESKKIQKADLSYPILVLVDDDGEVLYILDGNHRLHKAIDNELETIKAKMIPSSSLPEKIKKVLL